MKSDAQLREEIIRDLPETTDLVERLTINGVEMPKRIWLTDEGSGDICWANEPDPSGDGEAEAVEYVRADTITALQARVEKLEDALAAAADVMSEANYEGYFDSDIADARAALAEGSDYYGIVEVNEDDFTPGGPHE